MKNLFNYFAKQKDNSTLSDLSTNELLSELLKRDEIPFMSLNNEEELKLNVLKSCWPEITPNQLYYVLNDNSFIQRIA